MVALPLRQPPAKLADAFLEMFRLELRRRPFSRTARVVHDPGLQARLRLARARLTMRPGSFMVAHACVPNRPAQLDSTLASAQAGDNLGSECRQPGRAMGVEQTTRAYHRAGPAYRTSPRCLAASSSAANMSTLSQCKPKSGSDVHMPCCGHERIHARTRRGAASVACTPIAHLAMNDAECTAAEFQDNPRTWHESRSEQPVREVIGLNSQAHTNGASVGRGDAFKATTACLT